MREQSEGGQFHRRVTALVRGRVNFMGQDWVSQETRVYLETKTLMKEKKTFTIENFLQVPMSMYNNIRARLLEQQQQLELQSHSGHTQWVTFVIDGLLFYPDPRFLHTNDQPC